MLHKMTKLSFALVRKWTYHISSLFLVNTFNPMKSSCKFYLCPFLESCLNKLFFFNAMLYYSFIVYTFRATFLSIYGYQCSYHSFCDSLKPRGFVLPLVMDIYVQLFKDNAKDPFGNYSGRKKVAFTEELSVLT